MACPFFDPTAPFSWEAWPNPPRLPLGDPHLGTCARTPGDEPDDARLRACCNVGYASAACPNVPQGGDDPDIVRIGIVRLEDESAAAEMRYVLERDHRPYRDGKLELRKGGVDRSLLERQARAFLNSYLRRMP